MCGCLNNGPAAVPNAWAPVGLSPSLAEGTQGWNSGVIGGRGPGVTGDPSAGREPRGGVAGAVSAVGDVTWAARGWSD